MHISSADVSPGHRYKFGVKAQKERIYQAIKDHQYGKITQAQLGLTLIDCGTKLTVTERIDPTLFGMTNDDNS